MQRFNLVFQIAFTGALVCVVFSDFQCFKQMMKECEEKLHHYDKWYASGPDLSYCKYNLGNYRCQTNASIVCGTGFEDVAAQALAAATELCSFGTPSYLAVHLDPNCNMTTFQQDGVCNRELLDELSKIMLESREKGESDTSKFNDMICRNIDTVRDCSYRKYERLCNRYTQLAFKKVFDAHVVLTKKVCSVGF